MENAEKLRSSLKRVDTGYSGYFIAWNFGGGLSVLSRMGKHSPLIRENVRFISKHTDVRSSEGTVKFGVFGVWNFKRGGRLTFTSFILTLPLSRLLNGTGYGMIAHIALLLNDMGTRWTSRLVGDRRIVTSCRSTWVSILENRINELTRMNQSAMDDGGENGI